MRGTSLFLLAGQPNHHPNSQENDRQSKLSKTTTFMGAVDAQREKWKKEERLRLTHELNATEQKLVEIKQALAKLSEDDASSSSASALVTGADAGANRSNQFCSLPPELLRAIVIQHQVYTTQFSCKAVHQSVQWSCRGRLTSHFPAMARERPQTNINWLLRYHTIARFPFIGKHLNQNAGIVDWSARYRMLCSGSEVVLSPFTKKVEQPRKANVNEYNFTLSVLTEKDGTLLAQVPLQLGKTGKKVTKQLLNEDCCEHCRYCQHCGEDNSQGEYYEDDVPCFEAKFVKPLEMPSANGNLIVCDYGKDHDPMRKIGALKPRHFVIHAHHRTKNGSGEPCTKFAHFLSFDAPCSEAHISPWAKGIKSFYGEAETKPRPSRYSRTQCEYKVPWEDLVSPSAGSSDYPLVVKINTEGKAVRVAYSASDGMSTFCYSLEGITIRIKNELGHCEWHEDDLSMREVKDVLRSLQWA